MLNSRIQSNGLTSTMTYLPQTDSELITLACWASNVVGRQTAPCLVHILPASKYCRKLLVNHPLLPPHNLLWPARRCPHLVCNLNKTPSACWLRGGVDVGLSRIYYAHLRIYLHNCLHSPASSLSLSLSLFLAECVDKLQLQLLRCRLGPIIIAKY